MSARAPVVVGVDGSPASLEAVRWAVDYTDARDAPLHLVHACGMPDSRLRDPSGAVRARQVDGAEILAEAEKLAFEITEHPARIMIATTLTARDVESALWAHTRAAAMLVLGARRPHTRTPHPLGSTGRAPVGRTRCPTTIVPWAGSAHPAPARLPVVVGVDGTPDGAAALEYGFVEARRRMVGLVAVTTWSTAVPQSSRRMMRRHALARQARALAAAQRRHPTVPVERIVLEGPAAEHLVNVGDGAQLLVLGGRRRATPGAVTRAVLSANTTPLTVVRSPRSVWSTARAAARPGSGDRPASEIARVLPAHPSSSTRGGPP